MTTCQDIIQIVENRLGHSLGADDGMRLGSPRQVVRGITVGWMATPEVIRAAAESHHNLLICHEALTYPYPSFARAQERDYLAWPTNQQRLKLLTENDIAVCRLHSSLDELFIYEAFAEQIGVVGVRAQGSRYHLRVFDIEPMRYGDVVEKVKQAMGLPAVRITPGSADRVVKTVGLPWGGMALFVNVGYMQQLIDLADIDVMIAGETDNYALRFCSELGIDVIETSHETSEERGLSQFAEWLRGAVDGIDVRFCATECAWVVR